MFKDIMYNLKMLKKKAKLIFKHNSFDIIEEEITFYVRLQVSIFEKFKLLEGRASKAYFSAKEVNAVKIKENKFYFHLLCVQIH